MQLKPNKNGCNMAPTHFSRLLRAVVVFSIGLALIWVATPGLAEVLKSCEPSAASENPLYKRALEAKRLLEASSTAADRKRQFADRWTLLRTEKEEADREAAEHDAECIRLTSVTADTLRKLQSCKAKCDQATDNQLAYQECQACAAPVNAELAQRESEYAAFKARGDSYNNRVLRWEEQLKIFIADATIPVQGEVNRMAVILADSPAKFVVADSDVGANPKPFHYVEYFEQVTKNADRINVAATRYSIDPDLIRAIIWMESTRGYYDSVTGLVLDPKTILPMNVYQEYWIGFNVTREGLQDPAINIDTGAKILARIQVRMSGGSVAKVATLYGNLGAQRESEYGKTVEYYYNTKPWLSRPDN